MANDKPVKTRKRSYNLNPKGWQQLQNAIADWARTNSEKANGEKLANFVRLSKDTIDKILQGEAVEKNSWCAIFRAFNIIFSNDYLLLDKSQSQTQVIIPNHLIGNLPSDAPQTRWVGRQPLIKDIIEKLQGNCRILSIVGITGIGKTSLAKQLAKQPQISQKFTEKEVSFYQESPNFEVVARCILGDEFANNAQLQENSEVLVSAMVERLKSQSILLILDMIEVLLKPDNVSRHQFEESKFKTFLERVVLADTMPSRIVLTSQDRPLIMEQEFYPDRFFEQRLGGLSEAEAIALFRQWDLTVEGGKTQEYLKRIIAVYEGHPLALSAIAGEVRVSPYEGNIESYWYDYGEEIEEAERLKTSTEGDSSQDKPTIDRFSPKLKDLVLIRIENTMRRLRKADPVAHELLCKGGIYRRPEERHAWLSLITWEPDREKRVLAFETLQRRFFVEEEKTASNKTLFRLHPLMRRIALEHLKELDREVQA